MKKVFYAFLFMLFGAFTQQLVAQCMPDSSFTSPGIYPATLPNTCVDAFYETVITIVVPVDTTITNPFPITVPIDSIVLEEVIGMPPGLSYSCAPPSCGFLGGSTACASISGTPTTPGTYPLDLSITVHVNTILGPIAFPDTLPAYYTIEVFPGVAATTSSTPANCAANDGTATVTVTAGTPPYTILWSTGDTTATIDSLVASFYTVNVMDSNGCEFFGSVTVGSLGQGATIDSVSTNIAWDGCGDEDLGLISPLVSGGVPPYSFLWSNGDTTLQADSLSSGSYSLTVTDDNGCSTTQMFEIEAPDPLTVEPTTFDSVSCAGAEDGMIEVGVAGGAGPYEYQWDGLPGETSNAIDNLGPGSYTLIVEDANGCVLTPTYEVFSPDSLLVGLSSMDQSIPGAMDGSAVATPSGGTPPYSYEWNTGGTSDTLSELEAGLYTVVVTDANGCETEAEIEISTLTSVDASWLSDIKMFPNPVSQQLTLQLEWVEMGAYQIEAYSLQGQLIHQEAGTASLRSEHQWEVQDWPSGMYLLHISQGEKRSIHKVMKQ
ncbi:MAG: T9SS type A sorting domain-containing protein [Bacteroidota bacterium]